MPPLPTILCMETPSEPQVFALAGLPGSGKSTAAEMIRDELERRASLREGATVNESQSDSEHRFERAVHTEVSDFCRTLYEQEHDGDSTDDNDLGRWTAKLKAEHGRGYILREMSKTLYDDQRPHVVISGLRSPEESEAVEDVFGQQNVTTIAIWTLPDLRFERKYGDKPSEEHPKWDEFLERNEREVHEWGCLHFFLEDGPADYVVANNGDESQLEGKVASIARHETGDTSLMSQTMTTTPFPDGLSKEHVASYL